MTDLRVTGTPSVVSRLLELNGNQLERALTLTAQQTLPNVVRVHVHADDVFVEFPDRVDHYDRLFIAEVHA